MAEENTTPQASQPPADQPAAAQPVAEAPATEKPAEAKPAAEKPAALTFGQKAELTKKKYEYINGKNMDPIAAEEAARKELGLPPMTEAEKTKSGSKNIFEKILDFFGLNEKLTAKPDTAQTVEAGMKDPQPAETSPSAEVSSFAKATEDKTEDKTEDEPAAQPEALAAENTKTAEPTPAPEASSFAKAPSFAKATEDKTEDEPAPVAPVQPAAPAPEGEKPQQ